MVKEYFTEAVVLDKEPIGELDLRVSLYTQLMGKISVKAKSARKITSKLSQHLEPLNIVKMRIIEKNGFQVADALKVERLPLQNINILKLISGAVLEGNPDYHLWSLIRSGTNFLKEILKALGFDPEFSLCATCQIKGPDFFIFSEAIYLCRRCFSGKLNPKEYLELSR